jgi:hypothetical protein
LIQLRLSLHACFIGQKNAGASIRLKFSSLH